MSDLILCGGCSRHLRRGEPICPFCGAEPSSEARSAAPRVAPPGLSRARLYAFHAAVATGVAASSCGSTLATGPGADAAPDRSAGQADAQDEQGGGSDAAEAAAATDAAAPPSDATADASSDAHDAADADVADWGPIPLPYGCVFPGGCDDVKV